MHYKLSKPSRETNQVMCVFKVNDDSSGLCIPFVDDNNDYRQYLKWLAEGNTPEPADEGNTPA
jgi:hypothetical protein